LNSNLKKTSQINGEFQYEQHSYSDLKNKVIQFESRTISLNLLLRQQLNTLKEDFEAGSKYSPIIQVLNKRIKDNPNDILSKRKRSEHFFNTKKYSDAIHDLNACIITTPNSVVYLNRRGHCFYQMHKYSEALLDFNKCLLIDPQHEDSLFLRAECFQFMMNYPKAINDYTKCIGFEFRKVASISQRGGCLRMMNKYSDAILDFNEALKIDPFCHALSARGECLRQMHKYTDALIDLDKALILNCNDVFSLTSRGSCFKHIEKWEEAIQDFSFSIHYNQYKCIPLLAESLCGRGVCWGKLKNYLQLANDFTLCMSVEIDEIIDEETDYYLEEIIASFVEGAKYLEDYLKGEPNNSDFQTCREKMIHYTEAMRKLMKNRQIE